MKSTLVSKIITYLLIPLALYGAIHLFTFSSDEVSLVVENEKAFQQDYRIYGLNIPKSISFANEEVPVMLVDVKEKLDRELLVNTYWQSNTLLYLKRSNKYFPIIEPILKENGVPDDFKYLAVIESGLTQAVSPSGAAGFWQFMKTTGSEFGLVINSEVDERYHIEKSTEAACAYLKDAYSKFGSWTLAAASYNMGQGGLQAQIDKQKVNSYYDLNLNSETGRYVYRIVVAKEILTHPEKYGFHCQEDLLWKSIETEPMVIDSTINDLALFSKNIGINYKVLKEYNPWIRTNSLSVIPGDSLVLDLPLRQYLPLLVAQ